MNPETAEAITSDLARIVDQARWAYVHGYWKAGHGLEALPGSALVAAKDAIEQEQRDRDPDFVRGETFELPVGGDHRARVAYQAALVAVARADVLLASLVEGPQPRLFRLTPYSRPDELVRTADCAAWRADHATVQNVKRTNAVRKALDRCVRGLSKALDAGPTTGIAHGEMCKTCGIRPRAEHTAVDGAVSLRRQGECETCARYRARTGQPRDAARLDGQWLNEARAAQARRRARGDDWGAA